MKLSPVLSCDGPVDSMRDKRERPVVLEELAAEKFEDISRVAEPTQPMQDHEVVAHETGAECRPIEGNCREHRQARRSSDKPPLANGQRRSPPPPPKSPPPPMANRAPLMPQVSCTQRDSRWL